MERIDTRFLVQEVDSDFETLKDRVFTNYERAVGYFKQLLGEFLVDAMNDAIEREDGSKDLKTFFDVYDHLYLEAGGGEELVEIPTKVEEFRENCNGIIRFGDFDDFVITIKMIEEVM